MTLLSVHGGRDVYAYTPYLRDGSTHHREARF
jgi:hypothetical protein